MARRIRLRPRYRRPYAKMGTFPKLVGIAMLGSFAIGGAVSGLINEEDNAVAQTPYSSLAAVSVKDKQATQQVGVSTKKHIAGYRHCVGSVRVNCVVDGDTIWSGGVKIRIADIDAPEVSTPRCAAEKALGNRATARLLELVNAGPFQMQAWQGRDEDKYGRKLRVLVRDGRSIGDMLVSEGLARTWSGKRQPWC